MKTKLNSVSPAFCLAKSLQSTLHLQNGESFSCCKSPPLVIPVTEVKEDFTALHNFSGRKAERKALAEGEKIKNCHYCWDLESLSPDLMSDRVRLSVSPWAAPHFDEVRKTGWQGSPTPTYMEVSFSSNCNFKCSYCEPTKSTKWMEEIQKHGAYPTSWRHNNIEQIKDAGKMPIPLSEPNPYVEAFWKWWPALYTSLKTFRITGGEPLLARDTMKVLEYIDAHPHPELELSINTNLGAPRKLIEKMADHVQSLTEQGKIKKFILHTSIDAWGAQAEYIRWGMRFDEYWDNVRFLLAKLPKVQTIFMCTYNALSVTSFDALLNGILELKREFPPTPENPGPRVVLDINHLEWPFHQSIRILPLEHQERIVASLHLMERHLVSSSRPIGFYDFEFLKMQRLIEWMREPVAAEWHTQFRSDFYRFFSEHDRRRGANFEKTFPALQAFWRSCQAQAQCSPVG